jgi:NAD(P)-dependent dehydrogenase (short-subunit alcohol dehydrogenase family)
MAIAPGDLTYLHTKQQQLNTMLRKQADTTGAQYVDTYQPSLGRDACSPRETRWIEPLIPQAPAAVQRLTRAALPHMVAGRRRLDRLTASVASVRGSAAGAAYTTAKHGIVGLPKSLAVMYRGQGIRANAIAAGATATNIQVDRRPKAYGPGLIGPYTGLCGKVADTEEQAAAIVFRASDAARCVNGAILPVDHGWHAI